MINIRNLPPDNLVAFTINGKIKKPELDQVADTVEQKIKKYHKVRVYAELRNFEGYTLPAFFKDLGWTTRHAKDFEKVAFVSEKDWLDKLSEATDDVISADVRHFSYEQAPEALAWVQQ